MSSLSRRCVFLGIPESKAAEFVSLVLPEALLASRIFETHRHAPKRNSPRRFVIVRIDAVPAELVFQMLGEGLLDQAVFAVDVGECHELSLVPAIHPLTRAQVFAKDADLAQVYLH